MGKKTDIVDQLVEWGHAVVDAQDDWVTYAYLEFKEHGRIHNVQIFSAAEPMFEATLGEAGTRFIFYEFAHLLGNRKTCRLMLFQPVQGPAYKLDLYGSVHPEYARQMSLGNLLMKVVLVTGILIGLISLPLLLFGVGILGLVVAAAMIWFARKALGNLNRMRDTYKSVLDGFPAAVEL
ncbi:Uncharacterised protein [Delftia tsuruhatensis]|uniref:hypothetical protein n=1 Tax=Delftia tsuruhatensis TaxID=180282 RepID=UPI001E7BCD9B|nr:hypothetical protein [Delftia tsuruhatensis]CAB5724052.1 Uncharacterised protein [Delftia tsuruhatensis]CAC9684187.1 Uncharacterised protein [Delftia tsuruhatensis]